MDTKELHQRALQEITELRRRNDILCAKVEVFELCASMVHARPPERQGGAMHPDIAHELRQAIAVAAVAESTPATPRMAEMVRRAAKAEIKARRR